MKKPKFGSWTNDIKAYCEAQNLDFQKALTMYVEWGIDFLNLLPDENDDSVVALHVGRNSNGSAHCVQTDYTDKFLR